MVLQAILTFQPLPISSHTGHDKVSSSALTDGPSQDILIHRRPQAAEPVNQVCRLISGPKINLPYKVYTSTPLSQTWKAGWYRGAFFALFCSFPQKKTGRLTYLSMVGKHSSTELGSSFRTSDLRQRIWSLTSSILQSTCVTLSNYWICWVWIFTLYIQPVCIFIEWIYVISLEMCMYNENLQLIGV